MKMLKKIAIIGSIAFVVIVVTLGILIKVFVDKDLVASLIEDNINGRVEIKDISVPIWAAFSGITIDGFKIGKKDKEMKKPMDQRSALKGEVIGFESFNFSVAIGKLIFSGGKDFEMKSLLLTKPKAHIVIGKNGGNNLTPLLIKPQTKEEKEAAKKEAEEAKKEEKKAKKEEKKVAKKEKAKPFSIKSIDTEVKMSKIGLVDGLFTVNLQKSGQTIILSDVDFLIKNIEIDPKNLKEKNSVTIDMGFTAALKESKRKGIKSFRVIFDSDMSIQPFNPKTGYVTENAYLRAGFLKGTFFTGLAVFKKIKSSTAQLQKIGVKLNFLKDKLELSDDAVAGIHYVSGKITFDDPPTLVTKDMRITLKKKDYIQTKTMKAKLTPTIVLAEEHSNKINAQVEAAIGKALSAALKNVKIPGGLGDKLSAASIRKELLKPATDDEGRFTIVALSTGALSDPNVKVIKPQFKSIGALIKGKMGGLGGSLKGLVADQTKKLKSKAKAQVNKAKKEATKKATQEIMKKKPKLPF